MHNSTVQIPLEWADLRLYQALTSAESGSFAYADQKPCMPWP